MFPSPAAQRRQERLSVAELLCSHQQLFITSHPASLFYSSSPFNLSLPPSSHFMSLFVSLSHSLLLLSLLIFFFLPLSSHSLRFLFPFFSYSFTSSLSVWHPFSLPSLLSSVLRRSWFNFLLCPSPFFPLTPSISLFLFFFHSFSLFTPTVFSSSSLSSPTNCHPFSLSSIHLSVHSPSPFLLLPPPSCLTLYLLLSPHLLLSIFTPSFFYLQILSLIFASILSSSFLLSPPLFLLSTSATSSPSISPLHISNLSFFLPLSLSLSSFIFPVIAKTLSSTLPILSHSFLPSFSTFFATHSINAFSFTLHPSAHHFSSFIHSTTLFILFIPQLPPLFFFSPSFRPLFLPPTFSIISICYPLLSLFFSRPLSFFTFFSLLLLPPLLSLSSLHLYFPPPPPSLPLSPTFPFALSFSFCLHYLVRPFLQPTLLHRPHPSPRLRSSCTV